MKKNISLSLLAFFSLSLNVACGEGSSVPSCEDLCNKWVECGEDENKLPKCLSDCSTFFENVLRDEVFAELANCTMELSCEASQEETNVCLSRAWAKGSTAAAMGMMEKVCTKDVECDDTNTITQESCVSEMETRDDLLAAFGVFKDSVLDCFADCINDLTCVEAKNSTIVNNCQNTCGIWIK